MGIRFACTQCGHVLNVKQELAGKRGICPKCQAKVDIPPASTVEKHARAREEDTPGVAIPRAEEPVVPTPAPAPAAPAPAVVAAPAAATPAAAPASLAAPAPAPVLASTVNEPAMIDPIAEAPHLQWYVLPPGAPSPYGPAPGDMMRIWIAEGRVSGDSMIWRQDWPDWVTASKVLPQLSAVPIPTSSATPAIVAPTTTTSAWHNSPAPAVPVTPHVVHGVKKKPPIVLIIALGVIVILLAIAAWWVTTH